VTAIAAFSPQGTKRTRWVPGRRAPTARRPPVRHGDVGLREVIGHQEIRNLVTEIREAGDGRGIEAVAERYVRQSDLGKARPAAAARPS